MSEQQLEFKLKLENEEIEAFSLKEVLKLETLLGNLRNLKLENYEIHIESPNSQVMFLFDSSSFEIRLNDAKNGVVLTQYEIDFFELLSSSCFDVCYTFKLKDLSETSVQAEKLITPWPLESKKKYCFIKFGSGIDSSNVGFVAPNIFNSKTFADRLKTLTSQTFKYRNSPDSQWKSVTFVNLVGNNPVEMIDSEARTRIEWSSYMEIFYESPNILSLSERETIKKSFAAKLTYSGKIQNTLIVEYICQIANLFNAKASTMYAPYGILAQSSGFGKSRGASEVGRRLATIYGVFRKPTETGYPHLSEWLNLIFGYIDKATEFDYEGDVDKTAKNYKVGRALMFFECLVASYLEFFMGRLTDDLVNKCFDQQGNVNLVLNDKELEKLCEVYDSSVTMFVERTADIKVFEAILKSNLEKASAKKDLVSVVMKSLTALSRKFVPINKLVFDKREGMDRAEWADFIKDHFGNKEAADTEPHRIWPTSCKCFPLVIVLDEAALLSELSPPGHANKLTVVRRALHLIDPCDSLVVVALGTNCDVSVLNKPKSDNSLRIVSRPNLYYPLIVTGNQDIHAAESKLEQLVIDGNFVRNRRMGLLKCSFGRPLWNSLNLSSLINVAVAKIRNGSNDSFTSFIAAWCIRVGLSVNASSKLSEKLLKSHMATLLASSSDGDRIIVNYSAEPILAIAARHYVSDSKLEYFQSLRQFVEGVPTDRGKIGESVLSEILTLAKDRSALIDSISDLNPAGASPRVLQLLRTREFLLEEPSNELLSSAEIPPSSDSFCKETFRATSVQNFLKSLYSANVSEQIEKFLPLPLLNGVLNFAQFISLHRDFPYREFFGDEPYEQLGDASGDLKKNCDIFDRAMSKLGLLKDIAFTCPFGYFGLDAFIPVLIEVEVEERVFKPSRPGNKRPFDEENIEAEFAGMDIEKEEPAEVVKVKKSVQSFIGVQYKVGSAEKAETIVKAAPWLHLNPNGYEQWELEVIEANYMVLILSSENDLKKLGKLSAATRKSLSGRYETKHYSAPKPPEVPPSSISEAFYQVPSDLEGPDTVSEAIASIKMSKDLLKPSTFTSVKVAPSVSVCGVSWPNQNRKFTCIWSSSLKAFQHLLGDAAMDIAHEIMRNVRPVFSNQIDDFARISLADATLNTQTAFFPGSDPLLRAYRGHNPLPPVLKNFEHWQNDFK